MFTLAYTKPIKNKFTLLIRVDINMFTFYISLINRTKSAWVFAMFYNTHSIPLLIISSSKEQLPNLSTVSSLSSYQYSPYDSGYYRVLWGPLMLWESFVPYPIISFVLDASQF